MTTTDEQYMTDAEFRAHHGRAANARMESLVNELSAIGSTVRTITRRDLVV